MWDLLFTNLGDVYPWRAEVRVAQSKGIFEFRLHRRGLLVTADRCLEPDAVNVLDAFLYQLLAEGE